MKKYYKLIFALLLGVFVFFPSLKVNAEALSDIRLYSDTIEVSADVLPEYTVTTTTDHASIEAYGGNTGWVHWEQGYQSWHGFGADVPTATLNPNAHWGMRIAVNLDSGYEFDENTRIFFNDVDVTGQDHNTINYSTFDWGGYVYIDLGKVDIGEDVYTVIYDYNGGNKNGESSTTYYWVSFALDGTLENFMEDVTPPEGKELDYVLVNGERMDFPFPFEINKDYTVKYMWKGIPVPITQFNITGVPYLINGKLPSISGLNVTTPGYGNINYQWLRDSDGEEMADGEKFVVGQRYILRVTFEELEDYLLVDDLDVVSSNIKPLKYDYNKDTKEIRLYFEAVKQTKVKITFNPNGGTVKPTSKNVYTYSTYGTLPKPSRKGCTFLGWYTAKSGGSKITATTETKNTKARTLYARWTYTKYKITYNLNKGTNNKANPATYTYKTKTFYFKNPSRKGYIFKGWFKDAKYKTKITYIKKGSTGNKTVYAKWAAISYKVVYNANGGKGSMKATTGLKFDKAFTLRANAFTKKGYKFIGWNTKKDGTGKTYANKEKVKNLTAKNGATVTLYAQWKKYAYTITYKLNGGTNNNVNPATYTISSAIVFKNPTKKGYSFKGWYSDSKLKNRITGIAKGSTGNKTVYAKWDAIKYKITYNADGGTLDPYTDYTFTIEDDVWLFEPEKDGYLFIGWFTDEELTNMITYIPAGTAKNMTVYAKWEVYSSQTYALKRALRMLEYYPLSRIKLIEYLTDMEDIEYDDAVWAADNCGANWSKNALKDAIEYLQDNHWSYKYLVEEILMDLDKYTREEAEYAADNCGANWKNNALQKAIENLEYAPNSYDGMIADLQTYDYFTLEEATYAANNCGADWNEQAIRYAKWAIDGYYSSRAMLIEQLINYYMFTEQQAIYGVDNAGFNFYEMAAKNAQDIQKTSHYSRTELIEILEINKFTTDEAIYGADTPNFNWGEEAVARMDSVYGNLTMTKEEIVEYLTFVGFTEDEAEYAANKLRP